ncbi:type I inositol polyphosphate 5-phosphatase 4-like isoform X2 [Wolffia australiana]
MNNDDRPQSKPTWRKNLAIKWSLVRCKSELNLNIDDTAQRGKNWDWRSSSFSERESWSFKKTRTGSSRRHLGPGQEKIFDLDPETSPNASNYRFQEIVPLNAGNVLVSESNAPAKKWISIISNTLNNSSSERSIKSNNNYNGGQSFRSTVAAPFAFTRVSSFPNLRSSFRIDSGGKEYDNRWSDSDEEDEGEGSFRAIILSPSSSSTDRDNDEKLDERLRYSLVARKQMVGIFLTVWVRTELKDEVRDLRVSCVGRGLMGYLRNKGSISISMSLKQTSICFVCCHLTSGEREGDELRRNSDVTSILKRTRFSAFNFHGERRLPDKILDHRLVIWLGDLNYRLAISPHAAKSLARAGDWASLLKKDQLHREQRSKRVFEKWKEGEISFPPTYKFLPNSDRFAGSDERAKEKGRTPAWCDRILWYGEGLSQQSYLRGDSKLSDHRPVYGVFTAELANSK